MPGGQHPSNPAELLSSNRLLNSWAFYVKYDIIIVDTPVLAVLIPVL